MTGINTGIVSDPVAPFGGVKESGFGREGGRHGMEEFQTSKVCSLHPLSGGDWPLTVNGTDNNARRSRSASHPSIGLIIELSQVMLRLHQATGNCIHAISQENFFIRLSGEVLLFLSAFFNISILVLHCP